MTYPCEIKSNMLSNTESSSSDLLNESSRVSENINSSPIKQICHFSVTCCQKSSKDLRNRLDEFLYTNSSVLEAMEKRFKQIQNVPILSYLLVSVALLILASEILWCLSLLGDISFKPGFCFLLILLIVVCGINGKIMGNLLMRSTQSSFALIKDKSKEI